MLRQCFELFDMDNSGTITTDELKKVLGKGSQVDDAEWDEILDEVDEDGNGEIDFEEFKIMMLKVLRKGEANETDQKS